MISKAIGFGIFGQLKLPKLNITTSHPSYCRYDHSPLELTIGEAKAILSLDNGLMDMCVGEVRRIVSPSNLAYGSAGRGKIYCSLDLNMSSIT